MKEGVSRLLNKMNAFQDGDFITTDIEAYAQKILENATIISITNFGEIKAFIAYYENNLVQKVAYLTMIVVDEDVQGCGYGKELIDFSITSLKRKGFLKYKLEVNKNNIKALTLYEMMGFRSVEEKEHSFYMELSL